MLRIFLHNRLYVLVAFFLLACEDDRKIELLPDAMESKGLADTIVGKEREMLINEIKELKKEILSGKDSGIYVTNKGRIHNPDVIYTEWYNACLTLKIIDDYLQAYSLNGNPAPEIFYEEVWVFRCKSDKDTISYNPQTISETNPPKCRDGKILNGKKYKQSIEAVRLWTVQDTVVPYSAYDELAGWIAKIREISEYIDIDLVDIVSHKSFVHDEVGIDKFIKVAKLARDAGFNKIDFWMYENDNFNNYEDIIKQYKIIKSIDGMQFYPTISLGEPFLKKSPSPEKPKSNAYELMKNPDFAKEIDKILERVKQTQP